MQEAESWKWMVEEATTDQLQLHAKLAGIPVKASWTRHRVVDHWKASKSVLLDKLDLCVIANLLKIKHDQIKQERIAHITEKAQEREKYKKDWRVLETYLVPGMTLYVYFYACEWYFGPDNAAPPSTCNRRLVKMQLSASSQPLLSRTAGPHNFFRKYFYDNCGTVCFLPLRQHIELLPNHEISWLSKPALPTPHCGRERGAKQQTAKLSSKTLLFLAGHPEDRPCWNPEYGLTFRHKVMIENEQAGWLICNVDLNIAAGLIEKHLPEPLALISAEYAFLST